MMHHFYPPRMKERERERERAMMDEDEEGKRERRSSALSTGPAYWRALRGGATPLCWIAVVYASRFLRFDSQPASPPLPPRKRAETGGREGGEREEWEEEVSHENRLRIKRLKVIWYLYRGNVAKFDKDRKDGEESFFSFFRVLIMEMKEEITNRDIGF